MDTICILGAARTGTHLLNAIISTSTRVQPMLTESVPLAEIVQAYQRTLSYADRRPDMYFTRLQDVASIHGAALLRMTRYLRVRFDAETIVYRSPMLSRQADLLLTLHQTAHLKTQIIAAVRKPADAVVSMMTWQKRRVAAGHPPLDRQSSSVPALARMFLGYYPTLLALADAGAPITFIRYEDLVTEPHQTVERLEGQLGLDLKGWWTATEWPRTLVRYSPEHPQLGPAITPLYDKPISASSVNSGRVLSVRQSRAVEEICQVVIDRFYSADAPEADQKAER